MKTKYLSLLSLFIITSLEAQVGVNTESPKATYQVVGKPEIVSVPDGVIAPKISRQQLIDKISYTAFQIGAIVYVTDLTGSPTGSTQNVNFIGYYYFDGTNWNYMNSSTSQFAFGDVKTGIQTSDHNGWVKLDGRSISSLTTTQQSRVTALGFSSNLPNASNSFLVQNQTAIGSVSGTNTRTISQSNLPNITLTSNFSSTGTPSGSVSLDQQSFILNDAGNHVHGVIANTDDGSVNNESAQGWPFGNTHSSVRTSDRTHSMKTSYLLTSLEGSHSHQISHNHSASFTGNALPGHTHTTPLGGSGQAFDITPRSLSVNVFVYLGE